MTGSIVRDWRGRTAFLAGSALLAAAIAVLAGGPGTATAHQRSIPTMIQTATSDVTLDGQAMFLGRVRSPTRDCRAFRRVTMTFLYTDGARRLVDRGPTSRNGAFTLLGPFDPEPDVAVFRAPRKRIAPKDKRHRHVCRGTRLRVPIN